MLMTWSNLVFNVLKDYVLRDLILWVPGLSKRPVLSSDLGRDRPK
jgi:hypothetical protein